MSALLFGMSALDPVTYGIAIAIMTLVALAAAWFPVRRAIAIDPVTALRAE
jgi:putative ABC transport system permease protein